MPVHRQLTSILNYIDWNPIGKHVSTSFSDTRSPPGVLPEVIYWGNHLNASFHLCCEAVFAAGESAPQRNSTHHPHTFHITCGKRSGKPSLPGLFSFFLPPRSLIFFPFPSSYGRSSHSVTSPVRQKDSIWGNIAKKLSVDSDRKIHYLQHCTDRKLGKKERPMTRFSCLMYLPLSIWALQA